jgi:DNA polymerase III delta prime subunit
MKIICLDNADAIPPSAQQILKKIIQDNETTIKFIFICKDKNKLIGHILGKGVVFTSKRMSERVAVSMVLSVCSKDSIGYNREGIRELFLLYNPVSLISILIYI